MSSTSILSLNELLDDKLFQVIGSTPRSVAESLSKINLKNRSKEGAQIFAISVFAAAVNKSTLETFLADPRFADIRPLINAALSIQGRSNMTALTLLGHCLLTTDLASQVNFTSEFRKKMGQNDLWSGELTSGSLSDKQREILKEKKRVTNQADAKALGSGYVKLVGLSRESMTRTEAEMFNMQVPPAGERQPSEQRIRAPSGPIERTPTPPVLEQRTRAPSDPIEEASVSSAGPTELFDVPGLGTVSIPAEVSDYRRRIMRLTTNDIISSITKNGVDGFIRRTRTLIERDPDGTKQQAFSTVSPRA